MNTMTETNYTPAQLEAWAGLGPWRALGTDPAEGVDCFWIKGQPNPAMRGFSDEIAAVNGSQNDPKRQTNAALIAAAPDLARLALERDAEIANLKRLLNVWMGQDDRFQPMLAGNPNAIDEFMAECAEAMKETSDE